MCTSVCMWMDIPRLGSWVLARDVRCGLGALVRILMAAPRRMYRLIMCCMYVSRYLCIYENM